MDEIERLLELGRADLAAGYPQYAREYFEKVLALDATNREAIDALARIDELRRKPAVPAKPIQVEPVKPPSKVATENKVMYYGLAAILVLAVVALVWIAYSIFIEPRRVVVAPSPTPTVVPSPTPVPPTATRRPTETPRPTSTPRPTATPYNPISFTDQRSIVEVEILQILTGYSVVRYGKIYSYERENALEQGKDVVYFEVRVKNQGFNGELNVSYVRFKLESTKGETFSAESSNDRIGAGIHKGRSTRGGMTFDIYRDAVPKLLRYDTGLRDTWSGEELEAISPDLEEYFQ